MEKGCSLPTPGVSLGLRSQLHLAEEADLVQPPQHRGRGPPHTLQHGVLGSFGVTQVLSLLLSPSPDHYTAGGNGVKPTSQGTPELAGRTKHPWGHRCLGWGEGSTPGGGHNHVPRLRHRPANIAGNAPASSPPTPASQRRRSGSDIGFGTGASPAHANAGRSENPPIPPKGEVGHLPPTRVVPQCCSTGAQPLARG